jgi:hypothetical protein
VEKAEYPQRQCREPVTEDGLIDHFCDGPELHPGPHAPSTSKAALERREAWEDANPGWEKLMAPSDPFAEIGATVPEERK